jgi:uncharacterized protein (DUF58 family)
MPEPATQPSNLPSFQSSSLPAIQSSNHPTIQPTHRLFDEPFLRKLERLAILSRRAMAGQLQGERRSTKRGQSVEFADFRPYSAGDDIRRIDWNAYARLERFFIKLFVEEEDLTVHLLVDTSRSMDWGQPNKLWYAIRAAAALGYIALVGLDQVTATGMGDTLGESFPPHRGRNQAFAFFDFLAGLNATGATDLRQALTRYAAQARRPGPLLLFSDLLDTAPWPSSNPAIQSSGWADGLQTLASRGFEVTVLHILSPDEVNPEASEWLSAGPTRDFKLLDSETDAEVEITADYDLLERYRDGLTAWQEELRRFCGARGIHYVSIETSLPFEELLFALLRQRGVLK